MGTFVTMPTLTQAASRKLDQALVEELDVCSTAGEFHVAAMKNMRARIGFDCGVFVPLWPGVRLPTPLDKPAAYRANFKPYLARPGHYDASHEKGRAAALRAGGGYIDTEVYTRRERSRLPFFVDMIRPQGICSQLVLYARFRQRTWASIMLQRCDTRSLFRPEHLRQLTHLVPLLTLAQSSFAAGRRDFDSDSLRGRFETLSPRERDIAIGVAQAMRTREIAAHLGISELSVRNRLSNIFDKVGASSRTELAVWMESIGLSDGWPEQDDAGRLPGPAQ
jgi:DNA-binding CsgD family transcriptional regulator